MRIQVATSAIATLEATWTPKIKIADSGLFTMTAKTSGPTPYYCRENTSDISGYRTIESSYDVDETDYQCTKTSTAFCDSEVALEEFATSSTELQGTRANVLADYKVMAKKHATDFPDLEYIKCYIYKRNSVGTETLLDVFESANLDVDWTDYTFSEDLNTDFDAGDRLVLKFFGHFINGIE